jgi:peptidoglycan/xylan/chitin deacetylase (PgdA/CDA1 family)
VLVYHRVASPAVDPFGQAVSSENFVAHLRVLRRRYAVSDVATMTDELRSGALRDGTVVVTFDDGYADVLHAAAPAAAAEAVPLHLFVTVEPVLSQQKFWWDRLAATTPHAEHTRFKQLPATEREAALDDFLGRFPPRGSDDFGRPMTPEELRTFAELPGTAVGAHTLSHPSLASLPEDEQRRELTESRTLLAELTGRSVDTVAYPFGKEDDVDATTRVLAAEAGYTAGFTSIALPVTRHSDPHGIPRLAVHDWDGEDFAHRLKAIFGF